MGFLFCFFFPLQNIKVLCQRGVLCAVFMTQMFLSDSVLYRKVNDYREVMCLLLSCSVLVDLII